MELIELNIKFEIVCFVCTFLFFHLSLCFSLPSICFVPHSLVSLWNVLTTFLCIIASNPKWLFAVIICHFAMKMEQVVKSRFIVMKYLIQWNVHDAFYVRYFTINLTLKHWLHRRFSTVYILWRLLVICSTVATVASLRLASALHNTAGSVEWFKSA